MFFIPLSTLTTYPAAMHEDDSCLQIPHQLKQFLTMLPSKYFGIFVSNKRHFDRNQVFPRALAQYFLFLLSNFCLKAQKTALATARTLEHAHETAQQGQLFIQFLGHIPVIAVR